MAILSWCRKMSLAGTKTISGGSCLVISPVESSVYGMVASKPLGDGSTRNADLKQRPPVIAPITMIR